MLKPALGYNNKINRYKKMVAALGIITFAAIFIFPWHNNPTKPQTSIEKTNVSGIGHGDEITKIEAPKFYGKDQKNQPYTITAKEGHEKTKGLMELATVWANLEMQDKTYIELNSKYADINTETNRLDLLGDVNITSNNGYVLNTNSAEVYYKDKSVNGYEHVLVVGDSGTISAPAFRITPNMQAVIFYNGRVHTTLNSKNIDAN